MSLFPRLSLFELLMRDPDHEAWNEDDCRELTLQQLRWFAVMWGAPKSGTKEKVMIRMLAVRQVRLKIAKYTEETFDQMVADFPKEALKWMAKEAGLWRSGNKRQLCAVLLNWRARARAEGKKLLEDTIAFNRPRWELNAKKPQQLTFDL